MYTALTIPHIQRRIFGEVDEWISDSDLLSLALTCKQFKETALDVLWIHWRDIKSLIRAASEEGDLWALTEDEKLVFLRELTEADWAKLQYYGRKIRSMNFWSDVGVEEATLQALCSYRPSEPLLPRIQTFWVEIQDTSAIRLFPYFPRLMHSELDYLSLSFSLEAADLGAQALKEFLFSLPEFGRTLKKLEGSQGSFRDDPEQMYDHSSIWEEFILNSNHLEHLAFDGVHVKPNLIEHLSQLPAFSQWRAADLQQNGPAINSILQDQKISFKYLKTLLTEPCPIDILINFMKRIDSPIEELHLAPKVDRLDLGEIEQLCSILSGFHQLRTLRMHVIGDWTFRSPGSISSAIDTLTALRQIEDINLNLPFTRFLEGSDLERMAVAWPQIKQLALHDSILMQTSAPLQINVKLEDLLCFARHCPKLESLSLSVNCQPFPLDKITITDAGNTSLTRIRFSYSPLEVGHVPAVLQCMKRMFPRLQDVHGHGSPPAGWKQVRKQFRKVFTSLEDGVESGGVLE